MNILIIAYYAHPDNNGGVKRPAAFASGLENYGHIVTILTHGDAKENREENIYRIKNLYDRNGLFGQFKIFIHKAKRKIRLLLGFYDTYYSDWKREVIKHSDEVIAKTNPEIIIASYPPVECIELGLYFANKYKIRLIADFRDPIIDETAEKHLIDKYPHMLSYFRKIERSVVSTSEKILVIAPSMREYYENIFQAKKVILLPNGYDSRLSPTRKESSPGGKFLIGYTGTISHFDPDRDLSEFFTALREGLNSEPTIFNKIEVRLYGNINQNDLGEHIDLVDSGHIKIMGIVSMDDSVRLQSGFDALLIITGINRRCVATGKIFEYLACGRPIIGLTKNTFAEEIINSTATGVCVSPRDKYGIYDLLKSAAINGGIAYDPNYEEIKRYSRKDQIMLLNEIIKNEI